MSQISPASAQDLDQIASVITSAIEAWPASERLKRSVLPVLAYDELDLEDHEVLVLEDAGSPVAVGAWQTDTHLADPHHRRSTLLHGLFVAQAAQGRGLGRCLQRVISRRAQEAGFHGLHVKAERFAADYFFRCGYRRLDESEQPGVPEAAYPHWFWQDCASIEKTLAR